MPAMIPLPAEAIRARKRPRAVLGVYLTELAWALLVATPAHAWARRTWGAHPDGDAVLFVPGGRDLMVWLGQEDSGLGIVSRTTLVLLMAGALVMQVALGALITSLAFARGGEGEGKRAPGFISAAGVGLRAAAPLSGALVLGSALGILMLMLGSFAGSAVAAATTDSLGDARAFTLRLVTFALFVLVTSVIGVVVDLARAAIGRDVALAATSGATSPGWTVMLRGVGTALVVARRHLGAATLAWAWRFVLSLALIALGFAAAQALGGKDGNALLALWIVHQGVVLGRVALRASWLARALALVTPVQNARDSVHNAHVSDEASPEGAGAAGDPTADPAT